VLIKKYIKSAIIADNKVSAKEVARKFCEETMIKVSQWTFSREIRQQGIFLVFLLLNPF
jgi:hypothetical protein